MAHGLKHSDLVSVYALKWTQYYCGESIVVLYYKAGTNRELLQLFTVFSLYIRVCVVRVCAEYAHFFLMKVTLLHIRTCHTMHLSPSLDISSEEEVGKGLTQA